MKVTVNIAYVVELPEGSTITPDHEGIGVGILLSNGTKLLPVGALEVNEGKGPTLASPSDFAHFDLAHGEILGVRISEVPEEDYTPEPFYGEVIFEPYVTQ